MKISTHSSDKAQKTLTSIILGFFLILMVLFIVVVNTASSIKLGPLW